MLVGTDMQCVGNTEMIPEKLMECGVLVNPYDLVDRDDRISVNGGLDKKVFCDKHIFRCELRKRASSSSAWSNSFFGLPNKARSWQQGESTGKKINRI